jgi:hypothetical protein
MKQEFEAKLEKLSLIESLHSDYAHLVSAFGNVAQRYRKMEEADKMHALASTLRKEGNRYGKMYVFHEEHKAEIEALDLDAIGENLKAEILKLVQNL